MTRLIIISVLIVLCACKELSKTGSAKVLSQEGLLVPSLFDNGDRIYFLLKTLTGQTIKAYTDSGGGWSVIYPSALKKLGLDSLIFISESGEENYVKAADLFSLSEFHPFLNEEQKKLSKESYFQVPDEEYLKSSGINFGDDQGFFGQFFFINHCWTFDYLNQEVYVEYDCNIDLNDPDAQKIGFKKKENGDKMYGHPSMVVSIQGEEIPMLFDTGATFHLSKSAQERLNRKEEIGGSFIAQSLYDKWRISNPNWNIIEGGDVIPEGGKVFPLDMIEVPEVKIGNHIVGPVWFSVRPDRAWSEWMIKSMDRVVKGALGGSALKYVSVTIDYPKESLVINN